MNLSSLFETTMRGAVLCEVLQYLDFREICSLVLTNKSFLQMITGLAYVPSNDNEHARTKNGSGYVWSGIVDKLCNDFGIHTDSNLCTHPNPFMRTFVSHNMREVLSNDKISFEDRLTSKPRYVDHLLDTITRSVLKKEFETPVAIKGREFDETRFLNWRRTVVMFHLWCQLHILRETQYHPKIAYSKNELQMFIGEAIVSAKHGVVTEVYDTFIYMWCVTRFIFDNHCNLHRAMRVNHIDGLHFLDEYTLNNYRSHQSDTFRHTMDYYSLRYIEPNSDFLRMQSTERVPTSVYVDSMDWIDDRDSPDDALHVNVCIKMFAKGVHGDILFLWTPGASVICLADRRDADDDFCKTIIRDVCKHETVSDVRCYTSPSDILCCNYYLQLTKQKTAQLENQPTYKFTATQNPGIVVDEFQKPSFLVWNSDTNRPQIQSWESYFPEQMVSNYVTQSLSTNIDRNQMYCCVTLDFYFHTSTSRTGDNVVYNLVLCQKTKVIKKMTIILATAPTKRHIISDFLPTLGSVHCHYENGTLSLYDYRKCVGLTFSFDDGHVPKYHNTKSNSPPQTIFGIRNDNGSSTKPLQERMFSFPANQE